MSKRSIEQEAPEKRQRTSKETLYLETVNRKKLDFDYEKICCVTLSKVNVYCCLVCGKYYQGRTSASVAFQHAIDEDHHVFMNMDTLKAYILPENQELVASSSLDDIRETIRPSYTAVDAVQWAYDLSHTRYRPGFIGLNNVCKTEYINVVVQLLGHVTSLRDELVGATFEDELTQVFALLVKKMWSAKLFKAHLSPHEFVHKVVEKSNKMFSVGTEGDPKNLLMWLLNVLKAKHKAQFQGKLEIKSTEITNETRDQVVQFKEAHTTTKQTKFWLLTLDLPPRPLFKDGLNIKQLPQVKLESLLEKYNGVQEHHLPHEVRRYTVTKPPKFLILHLNRLSESVVNQTVVEFSTEMRIFDCTYKLVSNIVHHEGGFKIQLRDELRSEWLEIDDLDIKVKEKEFLFLSESYIQVWEKV